METVSKSPKNQTETQKTYRIEHLPGIDVVENLDYPNQEERDLILEWIRNHPLSKDFPVGDYLDEMKTKITEGGNEMFYIKTKRPPEEQLNFIKNPLNAELLKRREDWGREARYAFIGVVNEINLSKRIREIVASNPAQELAREYGFEGIKFSEPICALVDKKNSRKYIIYKNLKNLKARLAYWGMYLADIYKLSEELKKIFLQNNINPNDLRPAQFMATQEEGKSYLVLIDTEAYVETDKPNN